METLYRSTRDQTGHTVTASQAILQGLPQDGGLYVPVDLPDLNLDLAKLSTASYQEITYQVMQAFFSDFTAEELRDCINQAYAQQSTIAPLRKSQDGYFLELFHGPTLSFKDLTMALLPQLLLTAAQKQTSDKDLVVLTATTGAAGKAALTNFAGVTGVKALSFYPEADISAIQKQQLVAQTGDNTAAIALAGNFDQAQTQVKLLLNDQELRQQLAHNHYQLAAANSLNIGVLIPQIAYYIYAYTQLLNQKTITLGTKINFSVPTGNFGNILAGYYAQQLGVPINKLICATNRNDILSQFFQTGTYDINRKFYATSAPALDVFIASDLERLLFRLTGHNPEQTKRLMTTLITTGHYEINQAMFAELTSFYAGSADDTAITKEINRIFRENQYTIDPHTAVASAVARQYHQQTNDKTLTITLATASPFKFPNTILAALAGKRESQDGILAAQRLADFINLPLPDVLVKLIGAPALQKWTTTPDKMYQTIIDVLRLHA